MVFSGKGDITQQCGPMKMSLGALGTSFNTTSLVSTDIIVNDVRFDEGLDP